MKEKILIFLTRLLFRKSQINKTASSRFDQEENKGLIMSK